MKKLSYEPMVFVSARGVPFTIGVRFDQDEAASNAPGDATMSEQAKFPGGIIRFNLNYIQKSTNCESALAE